ncbi:hypothetical protein B5S28_g5070 [[Candida] boidinii]|nr:hypothetical protein B5S28_g5070 [[Candida] boidinii]OWB63064.1 hypothetical protein B5S29_g4018 [[Candida] boidinii]OWB74536.1 hypothetical protein B5S31_g4338 [[Candida] boidinii]OWB79915.1 hypothetical protein B5S32_g4155 [[Candida] boidinii]
MSSSITLNHKIRSLLQDVAIVICPFLMVLLVRDLMKYFNVELDDDLYHNEHNNLPSGLNNNILSFLKDTTSTSNLENPTIYNSLCTHCDWSLLQFMSGLINNYSPFDSNSFYNLIINNFIVAIYTLLTSLTICYLIVFYSICIYECTKKKFKNILQIIHEIF